MKYLFVDTNNFIGCALLIQPKHSPKTIKKLYELLDSGQAKLILPEVVETEFFRVVDTQLSTIKDIVNDFRKIVDKNFPEYFGTEKNEYIKSAESIFKKRKISSEVAKKEIKKIFESKKTIKIPITFEIFINAYKRALAGKKPYKYQFCPKCNDMKNIINADCIIFESIVSKIKEFGQAELVFCSRDKEDFALADKSNKKYILHPELSSSFPTGTNVKFHPTLVEALKFEFKTEINKIEADKITKYFEIYRKFQERTAEKLQDQVVFKNVLDSILSKTYSDLKPSAQHKDLDFTDSLQRNWKMWDVIRSMNAHKTDDEKIQDSKEKETDKNSKNK